MPPAPPTAVVTPVAVVTPRRPARIHDDDLSLLDQIIRAAQNPRVEGHRFSRAQRHGQTAGCDRAAQKSSHQPATINCFHWLLSPLAEMSAFVPS